MQTLRDLIRCLSAVIGLVVGMAGIAQAPLAARPEHKNRPEFAIGIPGGFVLQIRADGRLQRPAGEETAAFHRYDYILKVGPDQATCYTTNLLSRSWLRQTRINQARIDQARIDAYRLSPQGHLRRFASFAQQPNGYPYALTFGPQGRFLYVLSARRSSPRGSSLQDSVKGAFSVLTSYHVSRNGQITRLPIPERRIGAAPIRQEDILSPEDSTLQETMISDSQGRFLYLLKPQSHIVLQYRVTATGQLKPLSPPSVSLPQAPVRMIFPAAGKFLYLVNAQEHSAAQMQVGADGTLHQARFLQFGSTPRDTPLVIAPNGRFLYVGDATHSVTRQYALSQSGQLRSLLPPTAAFGPGEMAIDLTSRFLYTVHSGGYNQLLIQPYRISASGAPVRVKGDPTATYIDVALSFMHPN